MTPIIVVVIPVRARSSSSPRLRTGIHCDAASTRICSEGAGDGAHSSGACRQYRHRGEGLQDDDKQCEEHS